jgi:hypothetical protein
LDTSPRGQLDQPVAELGRIGEPVKTEGLDPASRQPDTREHPVGRFVQSEHAWAAVVPYAYRLHLKPLLGRTRSR